MCAATAPASILSCHARFTTVCIGDYPPDRFRAQSDAVTPLSPPCESGRPPKSLPSAILSEPTPLMSDDDDLPDLIDIPRPPCFLTGHSLAATLDTPSSLIESSTVGSGPQYDFDNEPDLLWDLYSPTPSQRADPYAPVRIILTHNPASHTPKDRGHTIRVGTPPNLKSLGVEIRMDDGHSYSVSSIHIRVHISSLSLIH